MNIYVNSSFYYRHQFSTLVKGQGVSKKCTNFHRLLPVVNISHCWRLFLNTLALPGQ